MALAGFLENELSRRFNFAAADRGAFNRCRLEEAAARLYAVYGKEPPALVLCCSPYQLLTLPSLVIGIFFSDAWQVVSMALAERELDQAFLDDYEQGFAALWAHGGQQLFAGMKSSSRIGRLYLDLETALLKQLKAELLQWLASGKLPAFENTLPKQIVYRQFWAMHLWHLNQISQRLRAFQDELQEALEQEAKRQPVQWLQFDPYMNQLRRGFRSAASSMRSLVGSMGAEPASQMKHSVFLPLEIDTVVLSSIWQEQVNPDFNAGAADELAAWQELAQHAFAVICLDQVMFACQKPERLSVDEIGRLHNSDGPSLLFNDGMSAWSWHGVFVDKRVIEEPESITIEEIETASNAEIRRVLIERYGQARFLHDSGAAEISKDEFGSLYRKDIPGDEPLVMVKVLNSTAEPDGTFKNYFLRVPPEMQTAKEAVAWTFGFDEEDYMPLRET